MSFSAVSLRELLEADTPSEASGLVVAVSGGSDSASLLTAAARLSPPFRNLPLRAVHVDHGLQPAAAGLRRACEDLCLRLQVPLSVLRVAVPSAGESIEAAARDVRYETLGKQLGARECLLTAHHADDQAETVLLQLLRGAGLKGLCAMPAIRRWHCGWHLRPLLTVPQSELRAFADFANIVAAPDPMNLDLRFDRVYLRSRVWPSLLERWPGAVTALSRAARHAADGQALLDSRGAVALETLRDGATLSVPGLRALSMTEQRNVLRHWVSANDAQLPSTARLTEALRQIMAADADRLPAIVWGEHALRRYRDRLYITAAQPPRIDESTEWHVGPGCALDLGRRLGSLLWTPRIGGLDAGRLPGTLQVRRRRGGESLRPQRRGRTQTVQHLCQSMGVVPWMRDALPFVYAGHSLIAVGDLWQDTRWCVAPREPGLGCDWRGAPFLV